MRTTFPLTTHPATFLFTPWLVLLILFATLQGVKVDASGYWVGVVSSATVFTVFSCTFAALSAALSASRVRRGRLLRLAPVRSSLQIAWSGLWPTLAFAAILQTAGVGMASSGTWGSPGRFPWEVILAWAAMITFHAVMGYGLGMLLPVLVSAPLALLLSYAWLGFTWAMSYVPLRYLSGLAISGCCAAYASLPWQAPAAVVIFSVGGILAIGGLLALTRSSKNKFLTIAGCSAVMAACTALALTIAQNLGPFPSPPRPQADLQCTSTPAASVCLFPEQRWKAAANAPAVIAAALQRLDAASIPTPTRVSAALLDHTPGSLAIVYRRDFGADTIVGSLASSLVPQRQEGEICKRDDVDARPALLVSGVTQTVLYELASGNQGWTPYGDATVEKPAAQIIALAPAVRARWVTNAIAALGDCSLPLPHVPGASN